VNGGAAGTFETHAWRCVIVDFGMGNLRSLQHKLSRIGVDAAISAGPEEVEHADVLFLPGVGHFASGMRNLRERGLLPALHRAVLDRKTPIMGICLGMQLFSLRSEEGGVEGLGWLDAETQKFRFNDNGRWWLPHVGWNTVTPARQSALFAGIQSDQRFYFIHSYHLWCADEADVLTRTWYGYDFISAVQHENIFGTQFHPEKSHRRGIEVVRNFIKCAMVRRNDGGPD